MNLVENEVLKEKVDELIHKWHIQEWAHVKSLPCWGQKKKKIGSWHMCVDSHAINKIILGHSFPIPQLEDLLDQLQGLTMLLKID